MTQSTAEEFLQMAARGYARRVNMSKQGEWEIDSSGYTIQANGKRIAAVFKTGNPEYADHCRLIVTAVNAHAALLAACKAALANLRDRGADDGETGDLLRRAIELAEPK